jgi:hypothetical protein
LAQRERDIVLLNRASERAWREKHGSSGLRFNPKFASEIDFQSVSTDKHLLVETVPPR